MAQLGLSTHSSAVIPSESKEAEDVVYGVDLHDIESRLGTATDKVCACVTAHAKAPSVREGRLIGRPVGRRVPAERPADAVLAIPSYVEDSPETRRERVSGV